MVITIVILIILSTIVINMAFGDNGVVKYAESASDYAANDASSTSDMLNSAVSYIDNITNPETATTVVDAKGGNLYKDTTAITDELNNTVYIPGGFKVAADSATKVEDGIVIEDSEGNQFVWVPVDGVAESDMNAEENELLYAKHQYSSKYDDSSTNIAQSDGWVTWQYFGPDESYTSKDDGINIASVDNYKGFYIARYEAGIRKVSEGIYTSGVLTGENSWSSYNDDTTIGRPVSKFGYSAWNMISQTNAITVANSMYSNDKFVKSQLVDSYAWDTICNWIAITNSQDISDDNNRCITNSTSWGNYYNNSFSVSEGLVAEHVYADKGLIEFGNWDLINSDYIKEADSRVELLTGISGFKVNNIYDFAGNMYEWTTELVSRDGKKYTAPVLRGGSFINTGYNLCACNRRAIETLTGVDIGFGFRVVLYLK